MKITIVTGLPDSGKTTYLKKIMIEKKGTGCIAEKDFKNEKLLGYTLILYPEIISSPLARTTGDVFPLSEKKISPFTFGPFTFNQNVFDNCNDLLIEKVKEKKGLWIVDEVGPIELNEGGLAPSLRAILSEKRDLCLSVRPGLVIEVQNFFQFKADEIIDLDRHEADS